MVLFAADSNKMLLVLHSFKNTGGTWFCPEKKLMCLSGTREVATVFEVNPLTLMANCNLITPTINALCECTTATEVAELEAPDKNGLVTYPGSASFLPAPWLADAVVAANLSNLFLLIMVVNSLPAIGTHERQLFDKLLSSHLNKTQRGHFSNLMLGAVTS